MAKKQDILDTRDRLRLEVEDLDGGYATVGRLLKKSKQFVFKSLQVKNKPRLSTLEEISEAVSKAQKVQDLRLATINR